MVNLGSIVKVGQRYTFLGDSFIDFNIKDNDMSINKVSIKVRNKTVKEIIFNKITDIIKNYNNKKIVEEPSDLYEDPLKLLKLRYVKGEITKEQYVEMKKTIE